MIPKAHVAQLSQEVENMIKAANFDLDLFAGRNTPEQLKVITNELAGDPYICTLLSKYNQPIAILNAHGQLLVVNKAFLTAMNLENINELISQRFGNIVGCIHDQQQDFISGRCGLELHCVLNCRVARLVYDAANDGDRREIKDVSTQLQDGTTLSLDVVMERMNYKGATLLLAVLNNMQIL